MKHLLIATSLIALSTGAAPAQSKPDLTDQRQRISYALGQDIVRVLKLDDFDLDMKTLTSGMADFQAGHPLLDRKQQKEAMKQMQDDILNKAVAKKEAEGEIHKKEGAAFLAANRNKPGVKIKKVRGQDGSEAELQYMILESGPGKGGSPKPTDTVTVRYRSTLIDGKEFDIIDPALKHDDVAIIPMKDVIAGWSEALQTMQPGDKWRLFLPPSLAYADYGPPEIGIHTTLVYDLELVSFSAINPAPLPIR